MEDFREALSAQRRGTKVPTLSFSCPSCSTCRDGGSLPGPAQARPPRPWRVGHWESLRPLVTEADTQGHPVRLSSLPRRRPAGGDGEGWRHCPGSRGEGPPSRPPGAVMAAPASGPREALPGALRGRDQGTSCPRAQPSLQGGRWEELGGGIKTQGTRRPQSRVGWALPGPTHTSSRSCPSISWL